jgi:hypothetical protein
MRGKVIKRFIGVIVLSLSLLTLSVQVGSTKAKGDDYQVLSCRYDGVALNESSKESPLIQRFFHPSEWNTACVVSWSESNWKHSAKTFCCVGYFQMHTGVWGHLAKPDSLYDDIGNVRAASALRYIDGDFHQWDGASVNSHVTAVIVTGKTELKIPVDGLPSTK